MSNTQSEWKKYPKELPPYNGDYLCYYNGFCDVFEYYKGDFYEHHGVCSAIALSPTEFIWWQDLPAYPKDRFDEGE